MKSFVSVVIPCYNEEKNITKVLNDANRALDYLCRRYEIVVVNDGSTDKTGELIEKASRHNKAIRVVHHTKNKGYGAAVLHGLSAAQGDLVLMIDGDGQFDMREFSYILKGLKYSDVVIGYRIKRKDPFIRILNSFIFNWAVRIVFGLWVKDVNCAMKGFTRNVIDGLDIQARGALVNVDILTQSLRRGFKIVQVPIHHFPRLAGTPTGAKRNVIMKSFYEFARLFIREFPLRYREFSFRQRTTLGFLCAVLLLVFSKPSSGYHIITGLLIASAGLGLRNWAGGYLNKGKWLACSGPYAYIRHPLYVGSLLIGIGFCLIISNPAHVIITILLWALLCGYFLGVYPQKIFDEERNLKKLYHDEYTKYVSAVPRFFPFKGKFSINQKPFERTLWLKNTEYNSIIGFVLAFVWILFKMK